MNVKSIYWLLLLFALSACKKPNIIVVPDNQPPDYGTVPRLKVERYVNRLFIDLIGREAFDDELLMAVETLLEKGLSESARDRLILKLQTDSTFIQVDSSYRHAYFNRLYDWGKTRVLDGLSDPLIDYQIGRFEEKVFEDSIQNNAAGMTWALAEKEKLLQLKNSRQSMRSGTIHYQHHFQYLVYNFYYDQFHQGSFNFIYATYEDLLGRVPSQSEYEAAFKVLEYNHPAVILEQSCQDKWQYVQVLTGSREFYEQMIHWTFRTFLAREASSIEVFALLEAYYQDHDYAFIQRQILMSDEYADF